MLALLDGHPWFRLGSVTASERSAGRVYEEAARWVLPTPIPEEVACMEVRATGPALTEGLLFSALDASAAGSAETEYAEQGHVVVSNARNHRMDPDVPLLVPEVNPDHLDLVARQSFGGGAIIANPNCSTIGMVLALAPLHQAFGVERVNVVSLQAISGAGIPGVASLQIVDNVIPFISGEEDKLETEPLKILGKLEDGLVAPVSLTVSAQCNRVPVVDGHTLCISVKLGRAVSAEAIIDAWDAFRGEPTALGLPSAPARPVVYVDEPDQPPASDASRSREWYGCGGRKASPLPVARLEVRDDFAQHGPWSGGRCVAVCGAGGGAACGGGSSWLRRRPAWLLAARHTSTRGC